MMRPRNCNSERQWQTETQKSDIQHRHTMPFHIPSTRYPYGPPKHDEGEYSKKVQPAYASDTRRYRVIQNEQRRDTYGAHGDNPYPANSAVPRRSFWQGELDRQ